MNPSDGQPIIISNASIGSYSQLPSIGPNRDIYFINNYDLKTFRSDGTFLWSYVHGGTFATQPGEAVTGANGVIYFSSYDYNRYISRVHALNPDGTLNWMYVFGTGIRAQGSPVIGNNNIIYVAISSISATPSSGVSAFSSTGSLLWQLTGFRTRLSLFNSPIIGPDGTLYVIGEEPDNQNNYHPFLYAINTSSTGPANSSWPMWGANAQHTRVVGTGGGAQTTLTVTTSGSGTVTSTPGSINCGNACTGSFTPGTTVMLTATPDSGYLFSGWGGDCAWSGATCTLKMDANRSAVAIFQSQSPWLIPPDRFEGGPVTPPSLGGEKAVVITHGWNADATGWVNDLATSICNQLGNPKFEQPGGIVPNTLNTVCSTPNGWVVYVEDWRKKADLDVLWGEGGGPYAPT